MKLSVVPQKEGSPNGPIKFFINSHLHFATNRNSLRSCPHQSSYRKKYKVTKHPVKHSPRILNETTTSIIHFFKCFAYGNVFSKIKKDSVEFITREPVKCKELDQNTVHEANIGWHFNRQQCQRDKYLVAIIHHANQTNWTYRLERLKVRHHCHANQEVKHGFTLLLQ